MAEAVVITPAGELRLYLAESAPFGLSKAATQRLVDAFERTTAEGLLHLATELLDADLPAPLAAARDFARRYLTSLCRAEAGINHVRSDARHAVGTIAAPAREELEDLIEHWPPMRGNEYLSADTLVNWWRGLDAAVRTRTSAQTETEPGMAWLQALQPAWRAVGRVSLHLAENKRSDTHPFAFLATYVDGLNGKGEPRHQPLSRSIQAQARAGARDQLLGLLTPIQRAADRLPWLAELLDDGGIYQPLAWTPHEAWRFLQSVPVLSASGLTVRAPDWWHASRPPRPRVTVSVDAARKQTLDVNALLNFSVSVTLDGETLTSDEIESLLGDGEGAATATAMDAGAGAGVDERESRDVGLVRLRGRWVELDRERLGQVIAHWGTVARDTANGVEFSEAMRWLAGADLGSADRSDVESQGDARVDARDWVGIEPGPWLAQTLARLREPERLALDRIPGLQATLRPYQRTGAGWLDFMATLKLGACLADDMGLGKTVQVLALLLHMKARARAHRTSLLVVPASLMANWRAEIARFAPSLAAITLHPAETTIDLKDADEIGRSVATADLVITSYGMLTRLSSLAALDWKLLVLDEAQAIRNSGTRQAHAVKALRAETRIALTGTPVENRLSDLWSLFDFLNPGLLGTATAFRAFAKRLAESEPPDFGPLRRLVGPYILRRLKTDRRVIADLPDKTEMQAFCGLSKRQAALYGAAVDEFAQRLRAADGIARRGLVLAYLMRFKQICNHPAQALGYGDYASAESGKFQRLAALCGEIAERQQRVLVFTQFREITTPLSELLATVFGAPGLVLHGGTAIKRRQAMVERFQANDGPPFFILSLKAGGTGLNLTAASHVIHFDRWWNPAVEAQATDRAFRIGQQRNVLVHKFVCRGTVEERIDVMIREKLALADAVLEADGGKMLTEMDDAELLRFVALDVNKAGEL